MLLPLPEMLATALSASAVQERPAPASAPLSDHRRAPHGCRRRRRGAGPCHGDQWPRRAPHGGRGGLRRSVRSGALRRLGDPVSILRRSPPPLSPQPASARLLSRLDWKTESEGPALPWTSCMNALMKQVSRRLCPQAATAVGWPIPIHP